MKYYLVLYIATLLVMGIFDAVWLGAVAKNFYREQIGALFEFHRGPALIFYFMYAAGIVIFVSGGADMNGRDVATFGALLGFLAFATYDLTNLATIKDWPLKMSLVDMVWGTFNTSASATLGWLITRALLGQK